jgi:hypothetical protein
MAWGRCACHPHATPWPGSAQCRQAALPHPP